MEQNSASQVSLKEHIEARISALEKATILAAASLEKRLEGMNEFRAQLNKQAADFVTRDIYEARNRMLQVQLDELRLDRARLEGKASQSSVYFLYAIALVGVILSLTNVIYNFIK